MLFFSSFILEKNLRRWSNNKFFFSTFKKLFAGWKSSPNWPYACRLCRSVLRSLAAWNRWWKIRKGLGWSFNGAFLRNDRNFWIPLAGYPSSPESHRKWCGSTNIISLCRNLSYNLKIKTEVVPTTNIETHSQIFTWWTPFNHICLFFSCFCIYTNFRVLSNNNKNCLTWLSRVCFSPKKSHVFPPKKRSKHPMNSGSWLSRYWLRQWLWRCAKPARHRRKVYYFYFL